MNMATRAIIIRFIIVYFLIVILHVSFFWCKDTMFFASTVGISPKGVGENPYFFISGLRSTIYNWEVLYIIRYRTFASFALHALKGQKLLAQGIALGNYGRNPVAL